MQLGITQRVRPATPYIPVPEVRPVPVAGQRHLKARIELVGYCASTRPCHRKVHAVVADCNPHVRGPAACHRKRRLAYAREFHPARSSLICSAWGYMTFEAVLSPSSTAVLHMPASNAPETSYMASSLDRQSSDAARLMAVQAATYGSEGSLA